MILFPIFYSPITGTRDAGLFEIKGKLRPGVALEEAEQVVWEELDTMRYQLINDYELEKVKNKFESVQTFGNISYQRVAFRLAWFELTERAELINEESERYRTVDNISIQRVANDLFNPTNASILYYRKTN